jgi:hypothetical protein
MNGPSANAIFRRLLSQIEAFRLGKLDLPSLEYEFAGATGALDGAVSRIIRDAVFRTEGEINYAALEVGETQRRALALEALRAFEALVEKEYRDPSANT